MASIVNSQYSIVNKNKPIGVFDSGIGGLTVVNAITKLLPGESIIYFGDTAHLPYGDKSPHSIRQYAEKITAFLLEKDCKAILIACNTASALACKTVQQIAGKDIPVINVIEPVVNHVAKKYSGSRVGVIGTKGTINSRVYVKKIAKADKTIQVASLATPLLASMIEEGYFNNKISRTIINSYLSKPPLLKIDAIILACTHYPLIKKEIAEFYKKKVKIIDSAEIVAKHVAKVLAEKNLVSDDKKPRHEFYISDYTQSFEKSARIFFKEKIKLKEERLWKNEGV